MSQLTDMIQRIAFYSSLHIVPYQTLNVLQLIAGGRRGVAANQRNPLRQRLIPIFTRG